MTVSYKPIVTQSVAQQIAQQIEASITDGSLKADEKLPTEEALAKQFEVSRPTIREALKRLAAKSLIRSRRGPSGGTFVNLPRQEELADDLKSSVALMVSLGGFDLSDIAETRHELELICARLAANRREAAELHRMEAEILMQKDSSMSDEEFCASDVRFHRALVDATHNPALQFQMFTVIEALQPVENLVIFRFRERSRIVRYHETLLQAIRDSDVGAAEDAINDLMDYLRERFAQAQAYRAGKP